ncbi:MAG: hypothetical protein ABI306_09895 [Caulobacteraceae bacterium]
MNWTERSLAAAALVAVAASPALAAPDGALSFAAFVQVCGATHADYQAVLAAADAGGWKTTQVKADPFPGVTIADTLARDSSAGGSALTLHAWRGAKGAVQVSECTVRIAKARFADMQGAAQAWLGFAPRSATAKKATFMFADEGAAHRALTSADQEAAAAGAGMQILSVSGDEDGAILSVLKIKK